MGAFVEATLAFPAGLFTFLLFVVASYWVFVMLGVTDLGGDDSGNMDPDVSMAGVLTAAGLGGAPVSVVATVLIALAWFLSLAGGVLLQQVPPWAPHSLLSGLVLMGAVAGAYAGTRAAVAPLRRWNDDPAASRHDFVGLMCVVRTGSVSRDFGQAEVTAPDGAASVIQVRVVGQACGTAGWTALIYDYDAGREEFWVAPIEFSEASN